MAAASWVAQMPTATTIGQSPEAACRAGAQACSSLAASTVADLFLACGMKQVVHRPALAPDPVEHFDCFLEVFDAGTQRPVGAADVVGLDLERHLVAVTEIVRVDGKADGRDAAVTQIGLDPYRDVGARDHFAPPDHIGFAVDLVGLDAVLADGTPLGVIKAVQNYGAGDMIEIEEKGGNAIIIPFTRDAVPEVDFAGSRIVVTPPEELEGETEPPEGEENG